MDFGICNLEGLYLVMALSITSLGRIGRIE